MVRMPLPWRGSVPGMGMPGAAAWPDRGLVPLRGLLGAREGISQPAGKRERSGLSHQLSPRSKPAWVCPKTGKSSAHRGRALGAVVLPKRAPLTSEHLPHGFTQRLAGEASRAAGMNNLCFPPSFSWILGLCCLWGALPKMQATLLLLGDRACPAPACLSLYKTQELL